MELTITEALAEIKTILKRIESKRDFVRTYQFRLETLKDPIEGGSAKQISEEVQAIKDLEQRIVDLRRAIQTANEETKITLEGSELSIADWLIWRREVAPGKEKFLQELAMRLTGARDQLRRQSSSPWDKNGTPEKALDIVVNIDETKLAADREQIKSILGQLDGQLSLKNATVPLSI